MLDGIGEINSPGWTWSVDTKVAKNPFGLAFLAKLKIGLILNTWHYSSSWEYEV